MLWVAICAAALLFAPVFAAAALVRVFVRKPRKVRNPMPQFDPFTAYADRIQAGANWFAAQNPQSASIRSFDGLTLRAQIVEHPQAVGTIVFMHGYHGSGTRDFSCAMRFFYERGLNLVVPDQRASGASEGAYIAFGTLERFDCRDWVAFAARRFGPEQPILLDGVSMGAATVMLASEWDLPGRVVGAIVDAGYTSPYAIVRRVLNKGLKLPAWPVLPIVERMIRARGGYSLREADCERAVRQAKFPILFAHGGKDDFVPPRMGVACYEACGSEKRLFIVPGAGHGMSYLVEPAEYERLITEFLLERLK